MPKPAKVVPINAMPPPERVTETVDELGRLKIQIDVAARAAKRYDELRKTIIAWCADSPPEDPVTLQGTFYTVEVGPAALERSVISWRKLAKRLGNAWWTLVRVPLTEIDKHVPEIERGAFLTSERTGTRTVKSFPKQEAA